MKNKTKKQNTKDEFKRLKRGSPVFDIVANIKIPKTPFFNEVNNDTKN
jgi:hypothetical protein